jgi:hypothetical protein
MSEDEKNAQIGAAVSEYQAAKIALAHIEKKIEKVFWAYREVGRTMDKSHGTISEPKLENGTLKFGLYGSNLDASDILNATDLAAVVAERDQARMRLRIAAESMTSLGINGVS